MVISCLRLGLLKLTHEQTLKVSLLTTGCVAFECLEIAGCHHEGPRMVGVLRRLVVLLVRILVLFRSHRNELLGHEP